MTDIILTPDDLTLADEMNQLYSSKNGVNLSDNQVEFLRLLGVKNRSQATTKKLKMLIKLYRQEKRFLAAKAKAQGMIKREKDTRRKQQQWLYYVFGEGVFKAIQSDKQREKNDKLFGRLRTYMFISCAIGIIEKKDWIVIQKALLPNIKTTHTWIDFCKSTAKTDIGLAKLLLAFFEDNLARLGSPLSQEEIIQLTHEIEEYGQPD